MIGKILGQFEVHLMCIGDLVILRVPEQSDAVTNYIRKNDIEYRINAVIGNETSPPETIEIRSRDKVEIGSNRIYLAGEVKEKITHITRYSNHYYAFEKYSYIANALEVFMLDYCVINNIDVSNVVILNRIKDFIDEPSAVIAKQDHYVEYDLFFIDNYLIFKLLDMHKSLLNHIVGFEYRDFLDLKLARVFNDPKMGFEVGKTPNGGTRHIVDLILGVEKAAGVGQVKVANKYSYTYSSNIKKENYDAISQIVTDGFNFLVDKAKKPKANITINERFEEEVI